MYKSIDGLLISNSVKVETECVQLSVNCVQRVNSLFMNTYIVFNTVYNSTCTVRGPNTRSKLLTYTEKELKLYSSLRSLLLRKATSTLTVCATQEKGSTEIEKIVRKKIRCVIIYSGEVLYTVKILLMKRFLQWRKIALRFH
jgi:hypothetical protein